MNTTAYQVTDNTATAYISTGDKCKLFTLRVSRFIQTHDAQGYPMTIHRDYYVRNLGNNYDEAVEKVTAFAQAAGMAYELDAPELGVIKHGEPPVWALEQLDMIAAGQMPFGKYKGEMIEELANTKKGLGYLEYMVSVLPEESKQGKDAASVALRAAIVDGCAAQLAEAQAERARLQAEREAADAAALPMPELEGRVEIEGTVLAIKEVEQEAWGYHGGYETVYKMLIQHPDGWKVYGSRPASLADAQRGDRVKFTARFEVSRDDEKFGFFKRPTKASIITE